MRYAILTAVLGVALGGGATARAQGPADTGMTTPASQYTNSRHTGLKTSSPSKASQGPGVRPKVYGKLHYGHPLPRYARPLPKKAHAPWLHRKARPSKGGQSRSP